MSKIDQAVAWIRAIASDDSHGYDQTNRWGPDYDCSSLVISAWDSAGVPVKAQGATYTGNMKQTFLACGFSDVTEAVSRTTGSGIRPGDVLLHERNHTAMVVSPGRIVEAVGNEWGGIVGGSPGDQTGGEIRETGYYDYPWDCVLRCTAEETEDEPDAWETRVYTVEPGDTLWSIAERFLGDGSRWSDLMTWNGLADTLIRPGMELRLRGDVEMTCSPTLPVLREGNTGFAVSAVQTLLVLRGFACGVDGEFGPETASQVARFRTASGLSDSGSVDGGCWEALLR